VITSPYDEYVLEHIKPLIAKGVFIAALPVLFWLGFRRLSKTG